MSEEVIEDPFLREARITTLQIGRGLYQYTDPDEVASLLRDGFKATGLEYDVVGFDKLTTDSVPQPDIGVINSSSLVQSNIRERMDEKYGANMWRFVQIEGINGEERCFKPLAKPLPDSK